MGLPPTGVDPMPMRRAMMEYIEEHGQVRAKDMGHLCNDKYVPPLNWLQREGYIYCNRAGEKGALWSATAAGTKWITPVVGTPVLPRTRAYSGCVTESPDRLWPDVRGGASRAFEIASRGIAT